MQKKPIKQKVTILIKDNKLSQLEVMAKEREMSLPSLIEEVIEIGLMAMKFPSLRADPYKTLDIDPEFHSP
jgi:hypothetical protein